MRCAQVRLRRPRNAMNRFVPLVLAVLVAGCAKPRIPAPVEERNVSNRQVPALPPAAVAPEPVKAPGSESSGKPSLYTVKPGDTMIRIGLETGQNWKDLVKWNNLDNPNMIEVGQVLRVELVRLRVDDADAAGQCVPGFRRRRLPCDRCRGHGGETDHHRAQ